jgi:predicted nucleic acid-binding protein
MDDFFSRAVVCNTGPIIALSRASVGSLLSSLFPEVYVTNEVVAELTAKDAGDTSEILRTLTHVRVISSTLPDPLLLTELDAGEASVIQAARDRGLKGVLIDERRASRIAGDVYGLEVRGTCALLLRSKREGYIEEVMPILDAMVANGYFIGPRLRAECLRRAGE